MAAESGLQIILDELKSVSQILKDLPESQIETLAKESESYKNQLRRARILLQRAQLGQSTIALKQEIEHFMDDTKDVADRRNQRCGDCESSGN